MDSDPRKRVQVEIFGHSYQVRGSNDPERVIRLAERVDQAMNRIFEQHPRLDSHALAVLAALNFAEEYDALETEYDALLEALERDAGIVKKEEESKG
ncbi:cell division protein ZapA [Ferroacidibacillus organovorans]|uniref:Cell division protein ZapA n=1 Tax=Ferroacidibacillus organovorans TaxID=1765683 RepID=A0A161QH87_9BACL|nr:cell division protein ZapA [Ferroacidibacillus organovorans]KYP81580.1 hypothetical protein AYJ22_07070 [Ferroacidibacillus organovorans]OAG94085.1 hypothetical protein AYW79_07035 [Ferroacidibacillus organovorans]OPG15955.1 hypothetical protein B2M26_10200 [Ferroacidibacillus organovorans]